MPEFNSQLSTLPVRFTSRIPQNPTGSGFWCGSAMITCDATSFEATGWPWNSTISSFQEFHLFFGISQSLSKCVELKSLSTPLEPLMIWVSVFPSPSPWDLASVTRKSAWSARPSEADLQRLEKNSRTTKNMSFFLGGCCKMCHISTEYWRSTVYYDHFGEIEKDRSRSKLFLLNNHPTTKPKAGLSALHSAFRMLETQHFPSSSKQLRGVFLVIILKRKKGRVRHGILFLTENYLFHSLFHFAIQRRIGCESWLHDSLRPWYQLPQRKGVLGRLFGEAGLAARLTQIIITQHHRHLHRHEERDVWITFTFGTHSLHLFTSLYHFTNRLFLWDLVVWRNCYRRKLEVLGIGSKEAPTKEHWLTWFVLFIDLMESGSLPVGLRLGHS